MPLPENEVTTFNEMKAQAVTDFVNTMIGALEAGFVDYNNPTLSEIYRFAQTHVADNYGVEVPSLVEQWGEKMAEECGLGEAS